jgi:hypothetical protein
MKARVLAQRTAPRSHGGRRAGAGRKKDATRNLVTHAKRPPISARTPLHVTLRVCREVWNLRSQRAFPAIARALVAATHHEGEARVVHYSVQGNHIHLVAEAANRRVLSRRIQGLEIRIARALNKVMGRQRGRVFADRYHARALTSPRQVRNVLAYVLKNRHHHVGPRAAPIDRYSSGASFDGWRAPLVRIASSSRDGPRLVSPGRSWLLTKGWRRHGLIPL